MGNSFYSLNIRSGVYAVELFATAGLTANYSLGYPVVPPTDGQSMRWDATNNTFVWYTPSTGSGNGTVTSVALTAPNIFTVSGSPVTTSGTIALALASQAANTVFAAPSGASGAPTFRALTNADIPTGIDASKITGTLQRANIPNGTNATSFQLNGVNGVTLSNDAGSLRVFGADGTTLMDVYCRSLFVTNQVETTNTTTVNLGDSILLLNANFTTGTPSIDGGFTVRRGSSTNASFLWDEASDRFVAGLEDNKLPLDRWATVAITNASLTSGSYTFTHNLRKQFPEVIVTDNNNRKIELNITYNSVDACVVDFTRVGALTGTWNITAS